MEHAHSTIKKKEVTLMMDVPQLSETLVPTYTVSWCIYSLNDALCSYTVSRGKMDGKEKMVKIWKTAVQAVSVNVTKAYGEVQVTSKHS
jgi:hypothetical protein